jgi:hypothetical protein
MIVIIPSCKTASTLPLNTENVKQIPLRPKFYISPEFRQKAHTPLKPVKIDIMPVKVGETILNEIKVLMECAFSESGEISSTTDIYSNQLFDVIVVPEIMLLDMQQGSGFTIGGLLGTMGFGGSTNSIFQVKWTISDVRGQILWENTITATYNERCYTKLGYLSLMEKTIKNHFQQALEKMTGYNWWD